MVFNAERECAKTRSQERMQTRNRMKELANLNDLHEIQSWQCWLRSRSDESRLETLAGGIVCSISLHSSTFGYISEHIILAAQVSNQEIPAVLGVCSSQCCRRTLLWPLVHWGKESGSWRLSRDSLDFDSQRMKIAISKVLSLSKQKNPSANGRIAFQEVLVLQLPAKFHWAPDTGRWNRSWGQPGNSTRDIVWFCDFLRQASVKDTLIGTFEALL